ncbi:MAG: hypothetical protein QW613_07965, partial [Thermoprotei archaeon]
SLALILIAVISLIAAVYAGATVAVTTNTYQAQSGVYYVVTGNVGVAGQGFSVAIASNPQSTQPCSWSNGGTCTTATTAGHWLYTVQVTLTANTQPGQTYTVTVSWNTGSGYTTMGSLQFTTPSTITSGQSMTFVFDAGTNSFNAPLGIVITVQGS